MTNLETRSPSRRVRDKECGAEVPTDGELLTLWSAGTDPDALGVLVRRHGGMVFGVCRRTLGDTPDADDAFQATFLVLVRKGRALTHPEQVAGWLHGVALRVARRALADRTRRQGREEVIVDLAAPTPPDDARDLRQTLDEELNRLPEKYRLPIVLCELEGRTLDEAALLLGWPKGTVAGRLSRGRDLLRRRLSRRRGVVLPLFLLAAPAVPDPLVSATLETTTAKAAPTSRATALADSALGKTGRRLGLFLFLLTAGAIVLAAWQARALAGRAPTTDSPVAPAATPAAPVGGCHAS